MVHSSPVERSRSSVRKVHGFSSLRNGKRGKYIGKRGIYIGVVFMFLASMLFVRYWFQSSSAAVEMGEGTREASTPETQEKVFDLLLSPNETNPWKRGLFQRLDAVRAKCGELCEINNRAEFVRHISSSQSPGANFPSVTVPVDCPALFDMHEQDAGDATVPYPPPRELFKYFSAGNEIPVVMLKRYKNVYLGGQAKNWSQKGVNIQVDQAKNNTLRGTYGLHSANCMLNKLKTRTKLKGASILVIGSEYPWLEAAILSQGASRVTTLEYGRIFSEHPRIKTLVPSEFREQAKRGNLMFDGVISHSSIEHSGLGRYGDSLNPWADIISIARAWCVTKPEGFLVLGLPTGKDSVQFNGHRVYGKFRLPLVTANWEQVDGFDHRDTEFESVFSRGCGGGEIFVFKKSSSQRRTTRSN